MFQAQFLNNMVDKFEHCQIAAYADISTGVALFSTGPGHVPGEALRELCSEAGLSLGHPDAPAFGSETCNIAVKALAKSVCFYFRAPDAPQNAYLFKCDPDVDPTAFLASAKSDIFEGAQQ